MFSCPVRGRFQTLRIHSTIVEFISLSFLPFFFLWYINNKYYYNNNYYKHSIFFRKKIYLRYLFLLLFYFVDLVKRFEILEMKWEYMTFFFLSLYIFGGFGLNFVWWVHACPISARNII